MTLLFQLLRVHIRCLRTLPAFATSSHRLPLRLHVARLHGSVESVLCANCWRSKDSTSLGSELLPHSLFVSIDKPRKAVPGDFLGTIRASSM